jgi:hypothetical protein
MLQSSPGKFSEDSSCNKPLATQAEANELSYWVKLICRGFQLTSKASFNAKFVAVNSAVPVVGLWDASNPLTKSLAH